MKNNKDTAQRVKKTLLYRLFMLFRKYLPKPARLKIAEIHFKIYGRKMPWLALRFEVHLTDSCNLNCTGCMHFSSLCDTPDYLDINAYEKDVKRISQLTNGKCADIMILGGEPLLHPDVSSFLEITRKYFSVDVSSNDYGIIQFVTNGILLPRQTDQFWKTCSDNKIKIVVSDYPVKIEKDVIMEKAQMYMGGGIVFYGESIESKKWGSKDSWIKIPIDLDGRQDYKESFRKCSLGGVCFQLANGKIYKCARIAYVRYFNEHFNQKLNVQKDDYVDIYEVKSAGEILNRLTEPAPFCRYCKVNETSYNNVWKKSEKRIEEYL